LLLVCFREKFIEEMNILPSHQSSNVNPEQVTSAINAAFAEFLSNEPTNNATRVIHQPETIDLTDDSSPPISYRRNSKSIYTFDLKISK